jgi:hypothetical protein
MHFYVCIFRLILIDSFNMSTNNWKLINSSRLSAREEFINFSRRESFTSYKTENY